MLSVHRVMLPPYEYQLLLSVVGYEDSEVSLLVNTEDMLTPHTFVLSADTSILGLPRNIVIILLCKFIIWVNILWQMFTIKCYKITINYILDMVDMSKLKQVTLHNFKKFMCVVWKNKLKFTQFLQDMIGCTQPSNAGFYGLRWTLEWWDLTSSIITGIYTTN